MERLPVTFTTAARRQLRAADAWWRANRLAAPDALADEMTRTVELLATQPNVGTPVRTMRRRGVRRYYLRRMHYYVYHQLVDDEVVLLALWHASRGSEPPL